MRKLAPSIAARRFSGLSLGLCLACNPPFMTQDVSLLRVPGLDVDQSLVVVRDHLDSANKARSIALWSLRDQKINPEQARKIAGLYFCHIDRMVSEFDLWHFTWSIGNLYRSNSAQVRQVLESAHADASLRAAASREIADRMINGERYYGGDAHFLGRAARRRHLVVPGQRRYLQSASEHEHGPSQVDPAQRERCRAIFAQLGLAPTLQALPETASPACVELPGHEDSTSASRRD